MPKIAREKFKTLKNVFDAHTENILFKLISQGHFDGLQSPISIGKEANIFTALKGSKKVIVKIYRLETCDFNRMYDYIKFDERYLNLKKNRRRVIFAWCQREFRNLMKAREANVKAPMPIAFKDNVLVMEFIG
ncbi:MAG: serine protein kinase RIO, partial [Candidatus Woesearchaeota archaeon]|nr:serine protein kinase RIO [Candidatus Woesearchaeota archaeon]